MKNLSFVLIALLFTLPAFADLASNICDPSASRATLVSNWERDPRPERNELCAKADCVRSGVTIQREKCIVTEPVKGRENTVSVRYSEWVTNGNTSTQNGKLNRIVVGRQDQCFNACNPRGIRRRECLDCFKNRTDTIYDESLNYPEIGRVLLPGTKCHELCKDPEGPFVVQRVLTPACQQCVGINGLVAEAFQYMHVSSGRCFEVDKDNKYRMVDVSFCQNATELINTTFEIEKSWSELFSGGKGRCLELDDKTFGQIYKISAEMSKCDVTPINNDDRNAVSERERATPSTNAPRSRSSHQ